MTIHCHDKDNPILSPLFTYFLVGLPPGLLDPPPGFGGAGLPPGFGDPWIITFLAIYQ